jgi:hypothetical protein
VATARSFEVAGDHPPLKALVGLLEVMRKGEVMP